MSGDLISIKNYFTSNNIIIDDEWLESCVDWIKEENEGTNLTLDKLRLLIYEQWLLVDLADLQTPVLPRNITSEIKYTLNKTVCLQVQSVIDISKPKLHQIMLMRKTMVHDHKNEEFNQNGKRVLQLRLSDGIQEILATEYKPVECLNLNIRPGAKICLTAPLIIRRGQIFLQPGKIKLLGGEVEKLLISNAAENVLATILKLPLNPNPTNVEASFDDADKEFFTANTTQNTIKRENLSYQSTSNIVSNTRNQQNFSNPSTSNIVSNTRNQQNHTTVSNQQIQPKLEEDSIIEELEAAMLFSDADFEEMSRVKRKKEEPKPEIQLSLDDVFKDDFEQLLSQAVIEKVYTLEELFTIMDEGKTGSFKIHGQFNKVVEKMAMKDNKYSIKVCLEDDTGNGVFAFHSDVVSTLMGYSPETMISLKNQVCKQDPQVIAKLRSALDDFMKKLVSLNSDMMALLEEGADVPVITNICDT